ncbi:hypothetical protein ABZP36_012216 [Zizania latifolia]
MPPSAIEERSQALIPASSPGCRRAGEGGNGPQVSECGGAMTIGQPKVTSNTYLVYLKEQRQTHSGSTSDSSDTENNYSGYMNMQAPDFATIISILHGKEDMKHCNRIRRLRDPDFVPRMNAMNNSGQETVDEGSLLSVTLTEEQFRSVSIAHLLAKTLANR